MNKQTNPHFNSTNIDSCKITMASIPAIDALNLQIKLASVLAKIGSSIDWSIFNDLKFDTLKDKDSGGEGIDGTKWVSENKDVLSGLMVAISEIDTDITSYIIQELCKYAYVDGVSGEDFESCFSGKLGLPFKVAWFVGNATYGDFIKGLFQKSTDSKAETLDSTPLT